MPKRKPKQDDFRDFVLEQLSPLEGLSCRRMFGAFGLYLSDHFFAILHAGCLYLKTHPDTLEDFTSRGSQPFRPTEKQTLKSYYEVPPDILDNAAELQAWSRRAARA
jgi:DNA transformation protein and related proteins